MRYKVTVTYGDNQVITFYTEDISLASEMQSLICVHDVTLTREG